MLSPYNVSCIIMCVPACVHVPRAALMPWRQCVKAVREHQVPKIDAPHGKEMGRASERKRESKSERGRYSHLPDKKLRF